MRPQKVLLFDKAGADEDLPALLIDCPICRSPAGLMCGAVSSRSFRRDAPASPVIRFVHSLRARRGAGVARAREDR